MIGLCIESSHLRGMGHLFRSLIIAKELEKRKIKFIFLINNDEQSKTILTTNHYKFHIVDLEDHVSNWETALIKKFNISIWVNDRLDTIKSHSKNVIKNNIPLVTLDDLGSGANLASLNIVSLNSARFEEFHGANVLYGMDYLILNPEIKKYKRNRNILNSVLVTMGGSDTYGVSVGLVENLIKHNIRVTAVLGPNFQDLDRISRYTGENLTIKHNVPSMIEEMFNHDLAITGGGITPYEANASGLPCLIIANEKLEISNGEFLDKLGSSIFLGYYKEVDFSNIDISLDLPRMSKIGLESIKTDCVVNVVNEVLACRN